MTGRLAPMNKQAGMAIGLGVGVALLALGIVALIL